MDHGAERSNNKSKGFSGRKCMAPKAERAILKVSGGGIPKDQSRMMGLAMTRVGGTRSPTNGGLERDLSDSEDAQRGVELRCTYGLTAVSEEAKRHKASCVRRAWALIDPTGEARATAAARWGPLD